MNRPLRESGGPYRPPPRRPPRRPPAGPALPRDPFAGQLNSVFGPYEAWLKKQLGSLQAEAKRKEALQRNLAQGYAEYYGRTGPQQIQGIYNQAATNQAAFGKGFSDGMQIAQQQVAADANKQIAVARGTPITVGPEAANVAYGLGGYIPANTLNAQGAAFSSAAALMPAALLAEGGKRAGQVREEYSKEISSLRGKQADLKSKKAEARGKLMDARKEEATDAYNQGMLTQRQYAKILGLKDWRKYPNQPKPADHGGIDAPASKLARILLYDDGTPVLDRKGNTIPVAAEPEDPYTRSVGGYLYERDPVTGGYRRVAGTGRASDVPDAGYAPDPTVLADAAAYAKEAVYQSVTVAGGTTFDPEGKEIDKPKGKKRKRISWKDAVTYVHSRLYKGTPRWVAEEALWRYRKILPGAPKKRPKASAVPSGGVSSGNRIPASFKVTHPTSGLEGYGATDWFRPAGTVVGAPVSGRIVRVSGGAGTRGKGIYGWSVYLQGDDGSMYFLTHFGDIFVRSGRVRQGQALGTVADYGDADHIHVGRKGYA